MFRSLAVVSAAALVAGGSVLGASAASAAPTGPPIDTSEFKDGRYVVVLQEDALATYRGGLPNLSRTAPQQGEELDVTSSAAAAYTDHLEAIHEDVASDAGVSIEESMTAALNGFVADMTAEEAIALSADQRVAQVYPDEMLQITASPANEFMNLEGLWSQVGGAADAGAGVVVGVLDTGIAPENPLFAGEPLGTVAGAEPYLDGSTIRYEKSDGATFTGVCQTGAQFTADMCSTKIVSARYYVDGFGLSRIGTETQVPGEYASPRDGDGHGSHTASTAAGNHEVPVRSAADADLGTMSGVAPAARIAVYKVCWSGPDPADDNDDGCATSDSVRAINQAVVDGVDVINYSIGGGAASSVATATDQAFLGAAAAGVFVAVSAGNDGPGASTLDHASPWYTTVAAATVKNYEATINLPDDVRIPGGSVTVNMDPSATPVSGEFIYAGDIPASGATAANAALCQVGSLDAAQAAGKIVLCDRGENARAEKSQVVRDAGGIGMVLVNVTPGSIDLDDHAVPTVHADAQYRDQLLAAARQDPRVTITLTPGNTSGTETFAPVIAGFSSRGPVVADGSDVIKPDVTSAGVGIIAAGENAGGADPTFKFLSGTSMSSPHVAGLGAVYLSEHPNATPAEVKSALMTTATDLLNADGSTSTDVWAQGAGFTNTQSMMSPGLVYQNGPSDWYGYLRGVGYSLPESWVGSAIDPSDLNIASIGVGALAGTQTVTRTVTALEPGTYTPSVTGLPGVEATVAPSSMTFSAAGEQQSYTVTFTTGTAPLDQWSTGYLTWTSTEHTVRSPLAIRPVALAAPEWVEGTGTVGSSPITATPGDDGEISMTANGLAKVVRLGDHTGTTGTTQSYNVTIPADEMLHGFTLDGADGVSDLDLAVYRLNAAGTPVARWTSATEASDEQVYIANPTAGNYRVDVNIYSIEDGNSPTTYALDHVGVRRGQQDGGFRVEPSTVQATTGTPFTVDAKWNGLEPNSRYLGIVQYSVDESQTIVHVTTGDATMPEPERLAGADRYETAALISQQGYPDGADVVYVASGENFPDGLAAGPAAAHEGGPLLLTPRGGVVDALTDEIARLSPDRIVIVGGLPTVSAEVEAALAPLAPTVNRIAGADRFETSRMIADYAFDSSATVFLATGNAFPDALSAGAAAGKLDAPVVLVNGPAPRVDDASLALLSSLGTEQVFIAGSTLAVSNGIERDLINAPFRTSRFSGADRYLTALQMNRAIFQPTVPAMYIASGANFPDALAASALAAAQGSPLYLAQPGCVDSGIVSESLRLGQPDVVLLGGEPTLSAEVAQYTICP